jgi:RecJ-like exonuclease
MKTITLQLTVETEEDEQEQEHALPAKNEVCPDCEGEGYVLCEGMRGYAYSAEEFAESFDDEEAAEYCKRGGRYDVACPTCGGQRVVPVVDEARLAPEQRAIFAAWQEQEKRRARDRAEDLATMRAEDGYRW